MNPAHLRISIDDTPLPEFNEHSHPTEVVITQELNQHFRAELTLRQPLDRRFPVESAIGKTLFIEAIDESGDARGVFKGFVLEAELQYEIAGNFRCELVAVTKSYKMDLTPRFKYYETGSVEDMATELAGLHGLDFDGVNIPGDPHQTWHTQWAQTDWEFVKRLAAEHECWVRPDANGIQVVKGFDDTVEHPLPWRGEGNLLAFSLRGKLKQKKMDGAQYDPAVMESKAYTDIHSEPSFFPNTAADFIDAIKSESENQLPNGYVYDRGRARRHDLYEPKLERESRRSIGTTLTCKGRSRNCHLLAGDTILVQGAIDAEGKYALTKVVHKWDWKGYSNEFEGVAFQDFSAFEAPEPRRWYGLVPARVVQNADPDCAGRLKVAYYWMEGGEKTFWVRRLTPYAGQDRGVYFTPEVGDEVMIGFEDGDTERPVVVGATWNGVHTAPVQDFWGDEYGNNDVKRIITKSGHRIAMSDKEGKESISFATPNNTKISMFEKANETGRSIIQLCCEEGDVFVSAPDGRHHFRGLFFSRDIG